MLLRRMAARLNLHRGGPAAAPAPAALALRSLRGAAAAGAPPPRAPPAAGASPPPHARACASAAASSSSPAAAAASAAAAAAEVPPPQFMLYNTLTRRKEPFGPAPGAGRAVSMYVCGVTVYDLSHIGHARAYVAFDVLARHLRGPLGLDLTYVRNFTDVDDKIIARAAAAGEDPAALAARYAAEFGADMAALGCAPPDAEPRATAHVPDMVAAIEKIIAHGHGYVVPDTGDVYFDVASLPGYGALSGRREGDNRAGERVAVDGRKRGAADFALWKAARPGEPAWDSPWGRGRPGWHIECSAMIRAVLGPRPVDIHGGGADLVFPHHENELAQARAADAPCGCGGGGHGDAPSPEAASAGFVRFWVHNGFVNVDAEKMSKSLGNFFTIRDATARYHPAALRLFLVSAHYRAAVNYTRRALEEASDRLFYVAQALADADAALAAGGGGGGGGGGAGGAAAGAAPGAALGAEVAAAMADDLNTPAVVAALLAAARAANDLVHTKAGRKAKGRLADLASLAAAARGALAALGLPARAADAPRLLAELRAAALVRAGLTEADVEAAVAERAAARAAKDFAASDAVRARLAARGVLLMDTAGGGSEWRPGPLLDDAEAEEAAPAPAAV